MSLEGQLRSSEHVRCTTTLPPKAEVHPQSRYVTEVPGADMASYSITSSVHYWSAAI